LILYNKVEGRAMNKRKDKEKNAISREISSLKKTKVKLKKNSTGTKDKGEIKNE